MSKEKWGGVIKYKKPEQKVPAGMKMSVISSFYYMGNKRLIG